MDNEFVPISELYNFFWGFLLDKQIEKDRVQKNRYHLFIVVFLSCTFFMLKGLKILQIIYWSVAKCRYYEYSMKNFALLRGTVY